MAREPRPKWSVARFEKVQIPLFTFWPPAADSRQWIFSGKEKDTPPEPEICPSKWITEDVAWLMEKALNARLLDPNTRPGSWGLPTPTPHHAGQAQLRRVQFRPGPKGGSTELGLGTLVKGVCGAKAKLCALKGKCW